MCLRLRLQLNCRIVGIWSIPFRSLVCFCIVDPTPTSFMTVTIKQKEREVNTFAWGCFDLLIICADAMMSIAVTYYYYDRKTWWWR
jgi:hypothetical protein